MRGSFESQTGEQTNGEVWTAECTRPARQGDGWPDREFGRGVSLPDPRHIGAPLRIDGGWRGLPASDHPLHRGRIRMCTNGAPGQGALGGQRGFGENVAPLKSEPKPKPESKNRLCSPQLARLVSQD